MPRGTTTKRATTVKAKAEPVKKEVVVKNEEVVKEAETKKTFEATDGILCRSITPGRLYLEGLRTKMLYEFMGYGDEIEIEYADLAAAVNRNSAFLFKPYFIVMNDDFVNGQKKLKDFYDSIYDLSNIESLLNLPVDKLKKALEALPTGASESIKSIAATRIADGTLDSISKIKIIDEVFNTQLMLLTDLYE